jgi:DNA-binding NtrC family response regulator
VRELGNTLRRAAIWSDGADDLVGGRARSAAPVAKSTRPEVLGRPLGNGFNLRDLLKEVARHYLERAMDEAQGNKTKAPNSWACRATRP